MKHTLAQKWLSMVLAIIMLLTMMPLSVLAEAIDVTTATDLVSLASEPEVPAPPQLDIDVQPADVTADLDEEAVFFISASGERVTYQWQAYDAERDEWQDLSGQTNAELRLTASAERDGMKLRCVVADDLGDSKRSDAVALTVAFPALVIGAQPVDARVGVDGIAGFTVEADAYEVRYQWQAYDETTDTWQDLSGATGAMLTVNAVPANDGMQVRCVVSEYTGTKLISDAAALTVVYPELIIAQQPVDAVAEVYSTALFFVAANGYEVRYQWQRYDDNLGAWEDIPGKQDQILSMVAVGEDDGAKIRCMVSEFTGTTLASDEVTLSLTYPELAVTEQPADREAFYGSTVTFSAAAQGYGVDYQWQKRTGEDGAWTDLPGKTMDMLMLRADETNDGAQFRCVLTDHAGETLATDAATLTVTYPAVDVTAPADASAAPHALAAFRVTASGVSLTYQWQQYDAEQAAWVDMPGETRPDMMMAAVPAMDGAQVRCVVTGIGGVQTASEAATLRIAYPVLAIAAQPASMTVETNLRAVFSVRAEGYLLTYAWQRYDAAQDAWTDLAGETDRMLTLFAGLDTDGARVRCVVKDYSGAAMTSEEAVLTVTYPELAIVQQPMTTAARLGTLAIFGVKASGDGITYQWQIFRAADADVSMADGSNTGWETLDGETDSTLSLPATKENDGAYVRVMVTDSTGHSVTSDAVKLQLTYLEQSNEELSEQELLDLFNQMGLLNGGMTMLLDAGEAGNTTRCTVTVKYVNGAGVEQSRAKTSEVTRGQSISASPQMPSVLGYKVGNVTCENQGVELQWDADKLTYSIDSIQEDVEIKVIYVPDEVKYVVEYYKQKADGSDYDLVDRVEKKGLTESRIPETYETQKDKYASDGFYCLLYDVDQISADGTYVQRIFYDRNYYMVKFNLAGGYGVESVYDRVGAPVSVGTPTKPGYNFVGWMDKDGTLLPVKEEVFTCQIEPHTHRYDGSYQKYENWKFVTYYYGGCYPAGGRNWGGATSRTCGKQEHTHTKPPCYETVTKLDVAKNVPVGNVEYTAKWEPLSVNVTVVFWYENADDDNYSYAGMVTDTKTVGATVKSADYQNRSFTGRDATHFTYNSAKAETNVLVKGDGSTVVNVYFTRKTYTFTFKNGTKTIHSFTAKYGSDISDKWSFRGSDGINYPQQNPVTSWEPSGSDIYTTRIMRMERMPDENLTFTHKTTSNSKRYFRYYVQSLDGTNGDKTYGSMKYDLYLKETTDFLRIYYNDEFFILEGFERQKITSASKEGGKESTFAVTADNSKETTANNYYYFYYTRNKYDLAFYNYNAVETGTGGSVQYQAPLGKYDHTPSSYPSGLEPGAYEFEGWYLNPKCTGDKVDLNAMTMPASKLTLYAKWVPVQHQVKVFMDADCTELVESPNTFTVDHGKAVNPTPEMNAPDNGSMEFVGWFYKNDQGVEKAFDFNSTTVRSDLNVYAKWKRTEAVEYTVHYVYERGNESTTVPDGTEVAETLTASTYNDAVTVHAKVGGALYEKFQSGYFPVVNSHTIKLDASEGAVNEFTFYYHWLPYVPYVVKFVEVADEEGKVVIGPMKDADGNDIGTLFSKTQYENVKSVVTEYARNFAGYRLVSDYEVRRTLALGDNTYHNGNGLTISSEQAQQLCPNLSQQAPYVIENNIITFKYIKDTVNTTISEIHVKKRGDSETTFISRTETVKIGSEVTMKEQCPDNYYLDSVTVKTVAENHQYNAVQWATEAGKYENYKVTDAGLNIVFVYKAEEFYVRYQTADDKVTHYMEDVYRKDPATGELTAHYDVTGGVSAGCLYAGLYDSDDYYTRPWTEICGKDFEPEANKTYYVKELDEKYLIPMLVCNFNDGLMNCTYMVSTIDNGRYRTVGFLVADKNHQFVNEISDSLTVKLLGGVNKVYTPDNLFGHSGKLFSKRIEPALVKDQEVVVRPFLVTPDNVLVMGVKRQVYTAGDLTLNGVKFVRSDRYPSNPTKVDFENGTLSMASEFILTVPVYDGDDDDPTLANLDKEVDYGDEWQFR